MGIASRFFRIIGAYLGGMTELRTASANDTPLENTKEISEKDFVVSLLILTAELIRADGRIDKHELAYVRTFISEQFGIDNLATYTTLLEEILKQTYKPEPTCAFLKQNSSYETRLVLLQFLFGIANADYNIDVSELNTLKNFATLMGIEDTDYISLRAMYFVEVDSAYKILEIRPSASNEEVKRAFRTMAMKYHPDKVMHLGEGALRVAQEKYIKVQEAYDQIKKERGFN